MAAGMVSMSSPWLEPFLLIARTSQIVTAERHTPDEYWRMLGVPSI
jgi:hypothetical protein